MNELTVQYHHVLPLCRRFKLIHRNFKICHIKVSQSIVDTADSSSRLSMTNLKAQRIGLVINFKRKFNECVEAGALVMATATNNNNNQGYSV